MDENSVFVVFSIANEWGAKVINWPNCLFGTKVNNTLELVQNFYWLNYSVLKQLQLILILVHPIHLYLDQHIF